MTVKLVRGDLLQADTQALVNPVNCVGVMGKGLALQFKKKYPGMHAQYRSACGKAVVRIDSV